MNHRKLKLNKKYRPLSGDAGDEFFPNGIFEFNVTKMLAFMEANSESFPIEEVDLSTLVDYGGSDMMDQDTIATADLLNPIILAEISPERFNVIDGNHRLERARREGLKKIRARCIRPDQHIGFLTSVKAYEAYVRYWNEKIRQNL